MITITAAWLLAILALFILYLIYFLILKPLGGIKHYKDQGLKMDFFPLLGNAKGCIDAQATTGNFYGHWIRQIKDDPNLRVIGGNFFDRPQLYLVDPKLIKEFYKNQDNYIKLPKIIDLLKIITKNGLVTSEGEEWKRHRKIVASAFHFDLLKDMIPDVVKIADQFLEDLKSKDIKSINLTQEFETVAGEVIGRLFFGENFSDHRIQGQPVIYFLSDLVNRIGSEGPTLPFLLLGIKLIESGIFAKHRKMLKDIRDLQNFASIIIEQKKTQAQVKIGSRSLIDILLAQENTSSEQTLSTEEIINEFITFVGAGSNTTGSAVGRAIYYLHQNPQYKEKLMEEINKHFEDPSKVTLDSLNQMDFMTAFIKETLRFSPPVIGLLDREATRDHTLGDIKIAKGTAVNLGVLLNNFNPMYHDNVDEFYPERWLTDSKTRQSITKDAFVFVPFSSGARNCIGQHLAMNETRIILSLFLKKYDFVLDPNYKHQMTQRIVYEPLNVMNFKLIPKS